MTNPFGRCFVSYRRSRAAEVGRLALALKRRGVPIWQDVAHLAHAPLEDELRRTLTDQQTSCAILWITPDVSDSPVIQRIEYPLAIERSRKGDCFFVVPCAAGGASYDEAADAIDAGLVAGKLSDWNLKRIDGDPASDFALVGIARAALERRLNEIDKALSPNAPLKIEFFCRAASGAQSDSALQVDWSDDLSSRHADHAVWLDDLVPAAKDLAAAIRSVCPRRALEASGLPTISAAFSLGSAFLAPTGADLTWLQQMPTDHPQSTQSWSVRGERADSGFRCSHSGQTTAASGLAVLVSVSADVEPAFAATPTPDSGFRAILRVAPENGFPHTLQSAEQVRDVAHLVAEHVRQARVDYRPIDVVHIFFAGPVGLALMIGQLLNTLGPVQLYEHVASDGTGSYVRSVRLRPAE